MTKLRSSQKKGFGFLGSDDLIFSPSGNNFPKNCTFGTVGLP